MCLQDQHPQAKAAAGATGAMAATAATGAMEMLPVAQATGATEATAAMATLLLVVLGVAVAATTAILPLQEPATQAKTVVKVALSQAAMGKMVAMAVPQAVRKLTANLLGHASAMAL